LTNSCWRKIQSLGLSNEYKDTNSEIGKWFRHTFGILFLNVQVLCLFSDCFSYDFMSDRLDNDLFTEYSDYLVDNYIGDDCNYPPSLWAALSASLTRTTNAFSFYIQRQFL
jgi:hypothetical protein